MKNLAAAYRKSANIYEKNFAVMDETLYRLCRGHPDHQERSSVCAKLWLIGRTYATGIERKVKTTGAQGSSMSTVADFLHAHAKEIDNLIGELRSVREPLTEAMLRTIISVHGRLVRLLSRVTRGHQSTRSFVAKYLHFHNPAVPIYDSVAATALRRKIPWTNDLELFDLPKNADATYGWFLMRLFKLYRDVEAAGATIRVRHLDHYLLSLAGSGYTVG